MKKIHKLLIFIGMAVLIIAFVGVFYYTFESTVTGKGEIKDFFEITGDYRENLSHTSISVSDENPFYALIATPLAIHYDAEGEQTVIPLYVKNDENPAQTVNKLQMEYLHGYDTIDLTSEPISAKNFSLDLAKKYWKKSDAVLLINNTMKGYFLGINAVPIASYLSIPVIVTDTLDKDVKEVLSDLQVKKLIICGDSFKHYEDEYQYVAFDRVEQIVENASDLVMEKFGTLDYITITNPIDAWPPKVLDAVDYSLGPDTVKSTTMNSQSMIKFVIGYSFNKVHWEFTIPKDYKYALIEITGYNHELDGVDRYGDIANFDINPNYEGPTLGLPSTGNGIAKRDESGDIIEDSVFVERLMYDCGGKSYTISGSGFWSLLQEGRVSCDVTIKKLEHPVFEPMTGLSMIAPYLTAYHKGIVFGKTDFAFTADDYVIDKKGQTCPGFYLPGRNPALIPMADKHMHDKVHEPINKILAYIADITYEKEIDIKTLRDHYKENPVYIALVGGATALPQKTYQNLVEPIYDVDGDGIDDTVALNFGGGGTQSDNIYGNIDPIRYDWSNEADDIYSEYPYMENIVGRITGYDAQDGDALVVRTIFYDEIINGLGQWKNNFGNLFGGGVDFKIPLWVQVLNHLPVSKQILNLINTLSGEMVNYVDGPWKYDTGFSIILSQAIEHEIGEELGFHVDTALHEESMLDGLSEDAIDDLKTASLWNRLTFSKKQFENLVGEEKVQGREVLENSNFLWITGHGSIYNFGMDGPDLVNAGFDGIILNMPAIWQKLLKNFISPHFVTGFWGPGGFLGKIGAYHTRGVTSVDFNPSFIWLESCFCGKILGITPEANVGQSFMHSGVNCLIAATTGSNIPGGYLDPKDKLYDTFWKTNKVRRDWEKKAEQGEYPDFHFGHKIFNDVCYYLSEDDVSVGMAFRDAKNDYLPEDADWKLWWSPPLSSIGLSGAGDDEGFGTHIAAKYTTYHEFVLYGDPAFNPYEP